MLQYTVQSFWTSQQLNRFFKFHQWHLRACHAFYRKMLWKLCSSLVFPSLASSYQGNLTGHISLRANKGLLDAFTVAYFAITIAQLFHFKYSFLSLFFCFFIVLLFIYDTHYYHRAWYIFLILYIYLYCDVKLSWRTCNCFSCTFTQGFYLVKSFSWNMSPWLLKFD